MPRKDLLKQLFRPYRESDRESFADGARVIADEGREKHHPALASELLRRGIRPTRCPRQMGGALSG